MRKISSKFFKKRIWIVFVFSFLGFLFFGFTAQGVDIENPLQYDTFNELILRIVQFLQEVAVVVTALVIVLSGYYFVTSAGDPQKISQAKKMGLYALIGLVIILIAWGIVELLQKIIGVKKG